jgi:hypothetical protein|tara:strand:- start:2236 stop:3087 length:852 start_codon:yes stop_codon:yes gene_type:complete
MKNKIRKSIFIILTLFIACSKQSPTTLVGEAIIANVANPEEGLDLEYLWEFTNLPDQSSISNSDIDSGEDDLSITFIPDVPGTYSLEVSVFQYNDEISTQSFHFEVLDNENLVSDIKDESNISESDEILAKNDDLLYRSDAPKWFESEDILEITTEMENDKLLPKPQIKEDSERIIPSSPKKVETKKTTKSIRGQSIPYDKNRFTIQIASKKELSDAKQVAVDLIDAGYDAYIQKALFKETNETWYRIRVGSYQNKDTAIAVAESLSKNRPEKAWVDYVRLEK